MGENQASLAVVGAVSLIGLVAAVAGLIGHFVIGGPIPSLLAGLSLLVVSLAVSYAKHVPRTITESDAAGSGWHLDL